MGEALTPAFLVGAGLVAAVTAVAQLALEARVVGTTPLDGYVEFLLLAVPAVGLVYAGYWLHAAEFEPEAVWRIGGFAVAGALLAAALTTALLLAGSLTPLGPAGAVVLFVTTATEGSLLGVLAGTFAATDWRFRRERAVADELEMLHELVRHDARNRLTILGGHLTRLAEAADGPRDSVAVMEAQLDAIEGLLADTGDAARALRLEADPGSVDLAAVVRQQASLVRESYPGVSIDLDLPETQLVRGGDLLASAVDNLLANAVQHHDRSDPHLEVTASRVGDAVELRIADDGPGLPADRRDRAFEAGVGEGTGMGLYLVRTVVEGYGGTVRIGENEPRGTVVTLRLPAA